MGLAIRLYLFDDPDHMMAMKMINQAHARKGKVKSFTSYCGGLPSPEAANNPLAYKFRYFIQRKLVIEPIRFLFFYPRNPPKRSHNKILSWNTFSG